METAGADPGFLERGGGGVLLILTHFSKVSHENEIIWSHYFIFIGYLKTGAGRGFERTATELKQSREWLFTHRHSKRKKPLVALRCIRNQLELTDESFRSGSLWSLRSESSSCN